MRIAIAQVVTETNTFSPNLTGLEAFRQGGLFEGEEIRAKMRGLGEIGGFLAAFDERGGDVEVVPILRAWAIPGGRMTSDVLEYFERRLTAGLQDGLPLDGVLLSLHGAAAAEGVDDVEGYLSEAARRIVGRATPVVVTLDHHADVTQRIIDAVDALVAYRTLPHDPYETGLRAARILFSILDRKIHPTTAWRKIPMIAPTDRGRTTEWPMNEWHDLAREMERRPGVVAASHFFVHPYLDVPGVGWSAVVITDGDPGLADQLAAELAGKAWAMRADFWRVQRIPVEQAVRTAVAAKEGPILVCDVSDSVLSGAPGDGNCVLQELLRQGVVRMALLTLVDSLAVDAAIAAGVGSEITTPIGGRLDPVFGIPVEVTATVSGIATEGMSYPAGPFSMSDMGRSALLEVGSIKLVVSEFTGNGGTHPDIYRRFGIEPADAQIIVAKTYFYYENFASMVKGVYMADCPGLSGWDLRRFPWAKATRPLYPLDGDMEWRPD
jgi:microcystin degradation protein MlrC